MVLATQNYLHTHTGTHTKIKKKNKKNQGSTNCNRLKHDKIYGPETKPS